MKVNKVFRNKCLQHTINNLQSKISDLEKKIDDQKEVKKIDDQKEVLILILIS